MSDEAFMHELWIYCYCHQIDGYPLGHPTRANFHPIVPYKRNADLTYDRQGTLEMSTYSDFTAEQMFRLTEG